MRVATGHNSNGFLNFAAITSVLIVVSLLGTGCSPSKYAVNHVMVPMLDNARDAAYESNDIQTFRDAAPANLFLLEGMIRTDPDVSKLRLNAAMLYFSYGFAFIEESDPDYASLLYHKGFMHAFAALAKNKKLPPDPEVTVDEFVAALPELGDKDVPAAVWTAVNWAQYISLHLDQTSVLMDIPKVTSLLERVTELDPQYFEGLPYAMTGALHSFKPPMMGGDPEASSENFENAFGIAGDSFLLSQYLYARYYCYRIQDADLFEKTLNAVLMAKPPEPDPYQLLNLIAKEKSGSLLEESDELF